MALVYSAYSTITLDLTSLASSTDFSAGRESDAIDNSTNLYEEVFVSGSVAVGSTPTSNTTIAVYVYAQYDDTPTYHDVLDGTGSAEAFISVGVMQGSVRLLMTLTVDNPTSNRIYPMMATAISPLFGGAIPKRWGLFVTHNTGVALSASGNTGNFKYQGLKF